MAALFSFLLLILCITILITRRKREKGKVFRNRLYGHYYIGNDRIDQGVVEIVDRNKDYNTTDKDNGATIIDRNPHYANASLVVEDDGYAKIVPAASDDNIYATLTPSTKDGMVGNEMEANFSAQ